MGYIFVIFSRSEHPIELVFELETFIAHQIVLLYLPWKVYYSARYQFLNNMHFSVQNDNIINLKNPITFSGLYYIICIL